jgi:hypothetical protein
MLLHNINVAHFCAGNVLLFSVEKKIDFVISTAAGTKTL